MRRWRSHGLARIPSESARYAAALVQYLKKGDELCTGRFSRPKRDQDWSKSPAFGIETCRALRIYMPATDEKRAGFGGLTLWLSDGDRTVHSSSCLVLLEDFRQNDRPVSYKGVYPSGYTWLTWLIEEAGLENTILYSDKSDNTSILFEYRHALLDREILNALGNIGCQVGNERQISTLYRIRSVRPSMAHIFAYPIYILEA